ncbi:uncharacterized protein LOC62_01G000823 [Vanrija pseudolonga]|uniref:Uncharacterized protein n=1 Tax=Vanrija pseudolonga TaxID=143232 RepID=A0AAF1BEX8_9TREE|nr:hypothetical protein LOC62_01G000823 [Vanrija pseudolonga]
MARQGSDDSAPNFNGPESAESVATPPPAAMRLEFRPPRANEPRLSFRPTKIKDDKSFFAVCVSHDSDNYDRFPGCWDPTSPEYQPSAETAFYDAAGWAHPPPLPVLSHDDTSFIMEFVRKIYQKEDPEHPGLGHHGPRPAAAAAAPVPEAPEPSAPANPPYPAVPFPEAPMPFPPAHPQPYPFPDVPPEPEVDAAEAAAPARGPFDSPPPRAVRATTQAWIEDQRGARVPDEERSEEEKEA